MATIRKRNNKNIVVYWATDANGEKKQYWEPFDTLAKAKRRKAQVEFEQSNGTFVCPTVTTVKELMKELDNDPKQSKDAEEVATLLADSPELLALVKAMLIAKK